MNERILVIGAGAIGSLVAAQLAQSGQPVVLAGRARSARAINLDGLRVVENGATTTVHSVEGVDSLAAAFSGGTDYRLAVLAVKSYDTAQAAAELQAATSQPPPVLTLQNGVGNEETLMAALGPDRVLAGVITTPVSAPEPGVVLVERPRRRAGVADVANPGAIPVLGAADAAALLASAGFEARTYPDWRSLKWTKLVMNLLCNASCALLGWPPERVWADPRLASLEIAAWREAMAVVREQGCRLVNLGGYPLAALEPALRALPVAWLRGPLGRFVVGGRGGKMPSLYLDMESGKGRSEVRWLNGAVVDAARRLGQAAPANQALCDSLSAVVCGDEPWDAYRGQPEVLLGKWARG